MTGYAGSGMDLWELNLGNGQMLLLIIHFQGFIKEVVFCGDF